MVGVADDAGDGVPATGQQAAEAAGDLPMGSCDDDAHGRRLPRRPAGHSAAGCGPRGGPARRGCRSRSTAAASPARRRPVPADRERGEERPQRAVRAGRRRPRRAVRPSARRPSSSWSRPVSSTTSTPSPVSRSRSAVTRAAVTKGRSAARTATTSASPTAASPAASAGTGPPPGGASRTSSTPAGTGWGGPTTTRGAAPSSGGQDGGEHGPAADVQLRLGLAAQPGRASAGQHDRGEGRQRAHGRNGRARPRSTVGAVGRVTSRTPVLRIRGPVHTRRPDTVASEEPLEIRLGGTPLAVTMRTPGRRLRPGARLPGHRGGDHLGRRRRRAALLQLRRRRGPQHLQRRRRRPRPRRGGAGHRAGPELLHVQLVRGLRQGEHRRHPDEDRLRRRGRRHPADPGDAARAARPAPGGAAGVRQDRRAARGRAVHRRRRAGGAARGRRPAQRRRQGGRRRASARAGCRWPGTC